MAYVKTIWENLPSESTPINASNLNKIEQGIYDNSINIETNTAEIQNIKDAEIYSTSEVKTNKIWIDNKPIYRIVYHINSVSEGNNYFGDTTGIEEYINAYGVLHRSNGNHYFISSYQTTNAFVAIGMDNNTYNQFNLVLGSGISNITDAYVIVEYTKTTS